MLTLDKILCSEVTKFNFFLVNLFLFEKGYYTLAFTWINKYIHCGTFKGNLFQTFSSFIRNLFFIGTPNMNNLLKIFNTNLRLKQTKCYKIFFKVRKSFFCFLSRFCNYTSHLKLLNFLKL